MIQTYKYIVQSSEITIPVTSDLIILLRVDQQNLEKLQLHLFRVHFYIQIYVKKIYKFKID